MSSHHRSRLAALAIMGLAVLGACGDTEGVPAQRWDSAPPDTTAEQAVPSGASGDAVDCSGTDGATVIVEIGDFEFLPDPVSVSACDEIVWRNGHDQAHTSTGSGDVTWSTGNVAPGADADPIVFDTPGEHPYMCALHPFMKGVVEVS